MYLDVVWAPRDGESVGLTMPRLGPESDLGRTVRGPLRANPGIFAPFAVNSLPI